MPLPTVKGLIRPILLLTNRSEVFHNEAKIAHIRYQSSGQAQYLETALEKYESALTSNRSKNRAQRASVLSDYAFALWTQYQRLGQPEDLNRMIAMQEEALELWDDANTMPEGYPLYDCPGSYPLLILMLGNVYLASYRSTRSAAAFRKVFALYKRVSEGEEDDFRNQALLGMGIALWTRCDLEQTSERLDDAIANLEAVLKFTANKTSYDTMRARCLIHLSSAYRLKYTESGLLVKDLSRAIQYGCTHLQVPVEMKPPLRGERLYSLARPLLERYDRTQDVSDLEEVERLALEVHALDVQSEGFYDSDYCGTSADRASPTRSAPEKKMPN
ncbi:hypothetical protein BDZ97DRAFT_1807560 [Flammula alnicola]|nr:hypothetical protein BDZ97DRAFT_1807560 [Flammula alnicola]